MSHRALPIQQLRRMLAFLTILLLGVGTQAAPQPQVIWVTIEHYLSLLWIKLNVLGSARAQQATLITWGFGPWFQLAGAVQARAQLTEAELAKPKLIRV